MGAGSREGCSRQREEYCGSKQMCVGEGLLGDMDSAA